MDKDNSVAKPSFPISRFQYMGLHRPYYPYGNTPAEDLLENCGDTSLPSVLCLGCGDLRSCFYTLWKHFDPKISTTLKRFDGVRFTLNDNVPAILARNIVFLYMCLKLPKEKEEKKKWLCAMWAIWYCLEFHSNHLEILNSILLELVSFSESSEKWSGSNNPLHSIVDFNFPSCFSEVSAMWKHWLDTKPGVPTKQKIHDMRCKVQGKDINDSSEHSLCLSIGHTLVYPDNKESCSRKVSNRPLEVSSYLKTGCCFAELVFGLRMPHKKHRMLNLTMIESKDWTYNCHYGLIPFEGYYHTVEFILEKMVGHECEDLYSCFVPEESFKNDPFLSNSVQQFFLWVQSSNRALLNEDISISFCFDIQHCLSLCQQQIQNNQITSDKYSKMKYDIIDTSNLMDHLSPPNLIVTCMPLLKDAGALVTTTMCCKNCTDTGEELLSLCFGFSTRLFPVILGMRCISHEGPEYTNPVKINPSPPDLSHSIKIIPHVRKFVWTKEPHAQQFVFLQLSEAYEGSITEALINILGSHTYSLLNYGPGESITILTNNSIQTAIAILKVFLSLSENSTPLYSYWEPICKHLRNFGGPFLQSLQTQLLLNGIHAHLTVFETTCPMCKQRPLQDYLGLFCFSAAAYTPSTFFMAFVHKCSPRSADYLLNEALRGKDVHIFDSFDGNIFYGQVNLTFFVPLSFLHRHYKVSMVRVNRLQPPMKNSMEIIGSCDLNEICMPWTQYNFSPVGSISKSCTLSELGIVTKHICDSYQSKTEITLSEKVLAYLKTSTLTTSKVSSRNVELHCQNLKYDLHFNFPIDYSSLKIEHKSEDRVLISCQRQPYSLKEERPCFVAIPDHKISLPVYALDPKYLTSHGNMQITEEDHAILHTEPLLRQSTALLSLADIELREFLQSFFKFALKSSFFYVNTTGGECSCLIVINKVLFDYEHKTPAIDLAYCFVNDFDKSNIISKWKGIVESSDVRNMSVDKESLDILKEVFGYFACRTNGTLQSAENSSKCLLLQQANLHHAFTRAVVYALLRDPDQVLYGTEKNVLLKLMTKNFMPAVGGKKCVNCDKLTFTAKQCVKCRSVSYCSKSCQTKHWKVHKKECVIATVLQPKCNYCRANLDKREVETPSCKCDDVKYCSVECLKYDQSNHKEVCKKERQRQTHQKTTESSVELRYCSYCHSLLLWSEECSKCHRAHYCNSECLTQHMPEHQKKCIENQATAEQVKRLSSDKEVCSNCNQISENLKSCSHCLKVKYCDAACQKSDWPKYKADCQLTTLSEAEETSSTSTSVKVTATSNLASASSNNPSTSSILDSHCFHCNNVSQNLKKCTGCSKVKYCGTSCQKKDWPKHKSTCQQSKSQHFENISLKCSYCQNVSSDLKKCTKCGKVQYCNRSCQSRHWPQHKIICVETSKVANFTPASSNSTLTDRNAAAFASSTIASASPTTAVSAGSTSTFSSSKLASNIQTPVSSCNTPAPSSTSATTGLTRVSTSTSPALASSISASSSSTSATIGSTPASSSNSPALASSMSASASSFPVSDRSTCTPASSMHISSSPLSSQNEVSK